METKDAAAISGIIELERAGRPVRLPDFQLPVDLIFGVGKEEGLYAGKSSSGPWGGHGSDRHSLRALDAKVSHARPDTQSPIDPLQQVDRLLSRRSHRPDDLFLLCPGIKDDNMRAGHSNQAGDCTIGVYQRESIHVDRVHSAIMDEPFACRVIAGQVGHAITADPDAALAVFVHLAGKSGCAGMDRSQILQSVLGRIEA